MSTGATIRKFHWQDLKKFTELFNEINGVANTERAFDLELMRQFLSQPYCKPEENCFLAESDGALVGFTMITPELPILRAVASGGIVKSHGNQGTGRTLLENAIQHSTAMGASVLHIQASSDTPAWLHLLDSHGFRYVRTYSLMKWEGREVQPPDVPAGFGLRSLKIGQDEEALTRLQNSAFEGNWGFCPNTVEEIEARLGFKTSDPDGVVFVTDGERLAAYNWTFRATGPTSSTGWIGMTGVHPDYRGQGLGKATVLSGMVYLAAKGVRTIELEVDEQNDAAKDIYMSIGFRKVGQRPWYERALDR